MKLKRLFTAALAMLLAVCMFVGCSGKPVVENTPAASEPATAVVPEKGNTTPAAVEEPAEVPAEDISLKVMTWQYEDIEVAALKEIIALYNEKYPNVTVELVPVQDYETEYKLSFDGNQGPDVVYVDDTMQVLLERYGYLKDITDYVDSYGWKNIATGGILEYQNARHDGQYYSAAGNSNPRVMWYNTMIFDELNLAIPTTIDELTAACEIIKNAGYIPFESDPTTLLWMMSELVFDYAPYEDIKAWYYSEYTSDALREAWIKAAETIKGWQDAGYFRPELLSMDTNTAFAYFAGGTTAMFYCSASISGYFTAYGIPFVSAFQFPTVEAEDVKTIVSGAHGGWAVNSAIDEAKLEAAIEFINMFYTEEVNAIWVKAGFFSSLNYSVEGINEDPNYQAAVKAFEGTNVGFFLDNAQTGLYDKMLTRNEALLLGDVTPAEFEEQLNADYESLKAN